MATCSADVTLKERLKEQSELVNYAREVLDLLNSDDLLQKARDVREKVDLMDSKLHKGKENTAATIQSKIHTLNLQADLTGHCCYD